MFHFAAYAAEGLSPFMRKFNYSNNILSTVNIINQCIMHDVKRLVYTSSMSVYGYGDMPVYKTPDCECYWNSRIRQKEDKFNKISAYYFMETYMKYRYDALTILKADSTYAISLSLSDSYKCGSIEGMYLLFDDDEVIKDVNIICEYKYSDGLYKLSATMILSKEQFMRFTEHQIKSVKLGSIESDITPNKAYKILRLSQTLLNK